ncbi:2Fe-2S iron-sulfur cluster-binding protein [Acinetobacter sp. Marseille-Q1623]|uniref:2Fe-2S iron-sulfur cluster-binding protein n=1 Tax=Acinetobacter sp. Marseille-Q1623 TaxID=2697501 RepID=UPI00157A2BDB|nr:2Fe-2S iron-sulfur cluster-binding protein [Acinetobacter sp. Marseille-Q1623]
MYNIQIDGQGDFQCAPDDVLLRAGLREGLGISYECNAGGCGTCKIEVLSGEVENLWEDAPGLSDRDKRKGRLLACQCRPKSDCVIKVRLDEQCVPKVLPKKKKVTLKHVQFVTHDILEVHLQSDEPAQFIPGQYALIWVNQTLLRAYSMSNLPNDEGVWVFQIRRVPEGKMTNLLFDEQSRQQAEIQMDGPYGLAHLQEQPRPIVCVAGGSGLAPMLAIARGVAVNPHLQHHKVWFFHGGREQRDLFTENQLREWTELGDRLNYVPATSLELIDGIRSGFIHDVINEVLGEQLIQHEIYCAGPPPMVQSIEQMAHRAGIPQQQIHFDRFF